MLKHKNKILRLSAILCTLMVLVGTTSNAKALGFYSGVADGVKNFFSSQRWWYYDVVFDGNEADSGTTDPITHVHTHEEITLNNGFERVGYGFNGWNTAPDGSGDFVDTLVADEDDWSTFQDGALADGATVSNLGDTNGQTVTLYAQWRKLLYDVEFYANGGNGTMETMHFVYDNPQELSKCTFERPYSDFIGWNTKADGTGEWFSEAEISAKYEGTDNIADGATVSNLTNPDVDDVVELYAQWKVKPEYERWIYEVPADGYYRILVVGEAGADAHYKHNDFDGDANVYEIWDGKQGSYQEVVYKLKKGTMLWCIPNDSELAGETGAHYYCYGDMTNGVLTLTESGQQQAR